MTNAANILFVVIITFLQNPSNKDMTSMDFAWNWEWLTHLRQMDFPIVIIWLSLLSFLGASDLDFNFYHKIFDEANGIDPDGTPRIAASRLGLFCLPMSHI